MAYTFRRAYKALLATSATTAFAFLTNGVSSLMPVSAFGFFAFILIPVNYVLIVFYYPAFLVVYEESVRDRERRLLRALLRCFTCVPCRRADYKGWALALFLDQFDQDLDSSLVEIREKSESRGTARFSPSGDSPSGSEEGGALPSLSDPSSAAPAGRPLFWKTKSEGGSSQEKGKGSPKNRADLRSEKVQLHANPGDIELEGGRGEGSRSSGGSRDKSGRGPAGKGAKTKQAKDKAAAKAKPKLGQFLGLLMRGKGKR